MSKKIFVGGAFSFNQLIWVLGIVLSYAKSKNVTKIYIDNLAHYDGLSNLISENYSKYFDKISIYDFNELPSSKINFIQIIKLFLVYFEFLFLLNKKNFKNFSKNWAKYQMFHAAWDSLYINSKKNKINPSFIFKFKTIIFLLKYELKANKIFFNKFEHAFLGHSVYGSRILLYKLRQQNINVFCQAAYCIYKQPKNYDLTRSIIGLNLYKKISKKIKNYDIESFYYKRSRGITNYFDAEKAFKGKNFSESKLKNKFKNIIMLHIFNDSPFNYIDKNRIFFDYFEWIIETLKIISQSNENWLIKIHPNSNRWGENSKKLINEIILKYYTGDKNKIKIIFNEFSNISLIKHCQKLVTFNGTSAIEFACNGKKPIIIRDIFNKQVDKNLFIKPKDLLDYKKILTSDICELNYSVDLLTAKKVLYILEKFLSLKDDIGGINIYRGDSNKKLFDEDLEIILSKLPNFLKHIDKIVNFMNAGNTHTLSTYYHIK